MLPYNLTPVILWTMVVIVIVVTIGLMFDPGPLLGAC